MYNEIAPVVKIMNADGEAKDILPISESNGIYTYTITNLSDEDVVTIDDTANSCTFLMGKGYSGAWKNVTEVDVNKDNISDIEELLHTVNKSQHMQLHQSHLERLELVMM